MTEADRKRAAALEAAGSGPLAAAVERLVGGEARRDSELEARLAPHRQALGEEEVERYRRAGADAARRLWPRTSGSSPS